MSNKTLLHAVILPDQKCIARFGLDFSLLLKKSEEQLVQLVQLVQCQLVRLVQLVQLVPFGTVGTVGKVGNFYLAGAKNLYIIAVIGIKSCLNRDTRDF